jgi:hypothetical protein
MVNFKCFSFLSVHVFASGVTLAKILENIGNFAAVEVLYSGSVDGEVAFDGGEGRVLYATNARTVAMAVFRHVDVMNAIGQQKGDSENVS